MSRRRLVHFLDVDTREPLCDGLGHQAVAAVVNGVSICAVCAHRVTDDIGHAMTEGTLLAFPPRQGGAGA
jgi:hypothetical protein